MLTYELNDDFTGPRALPGAQLAGLVTSLFRLPTLNVTI